MRKTDKTPEARKSLKRRLIRDNLELGVMTLPTIVLMALFSYWPLFGIILAFKNYKVPQGIFGSPWSTPIFNNFRFIVESQDAWRMVRNTLGLNFLFIAAEVVVGVVFALLMFEIKKAFHVKAYQTMAILPSFLSWVAVGYIVYSLLDTEKGILNQIIGLFGAEPIAWYTEAAAWPLILLIVRLWHGVGLNSIIYYAALMGVDHELFEAAEVDGATRFKRIIHISIPELVPIVTIMTILSIGQIFRADFGLFYNVTRNVGALYETTDVIDTYIYRALIVNGNVGMSSAGSFIQSIVCFCTLMFTNAVVKKISPENALF